MGQSIVLMIFEEDATQRSSEAQSDFLQTPLGKVSTTMSQVGPQKSSPSIRTDDHLARFTSSRPALQPTEEYASLAALKDVKLDIKALRVDLQEEFSHNMKSKDREIKYELKFLNKKLEETTKGTSYQQRRS
ncbi:hypothetical protein LTS17_009610 [Exophiala oligosperma]